MGSPLAPVLANFFMGHYEGLWLEKFTGTQVLYYRRYIDDIICCFQNSHDADVLFQYLKGPLTYFLGCVAKDVMVK